MDNLQIFFAFFMFFVALWLFVTAVDMLDKLYRRLTKRPPDRETTCSNCGMSQSTLFGKCDVCGTRRNNG